MLCSSAASSTPVAPAPMIAMSSCSSRNGSGWVLARMHALTSRRWKRSASFTVSSRDRVLLHARRAEVVGVAADRQHQRVVRERARGRELHAIVVDVRGDVHDALARDRGRPSRPVGSGTRASAPAPCSRAPRTRGRCCPPPRACSIGFQMCRRARSTSITRALRLRPSFSPRRVTSSSPPAPPPTTTMRCRCVAAWSASGARRSTPLDRAISAADRRWRRRACRAPRYRSESSFLPRADLDQGLAR